MAKIRLAGSLGRRIRVGGVTGGGAPAETFVILLENDDTLIAENDDTLVLEAA